MLTPIFILSIMGILFGLGLAFADNIFKVEIDPRIEKLLSVLPGANCGACGKAGCAGLAEAIAKGDMSLTSCPAGGEDVYNKIADILGLENKSISKKIARVKCGGGKNAKDKYKYQGVYKCGAVVLLGGGQKLCRFGCLGFGDCVRICPFDAIHLSNEGIPIVDPAKCTACGKCVEVCPKDIIVIEEVKNRYYIKCFSTDKTSFVRSACSVGCIGCGLCEKLSKGVFLVKDNLASIDYSKVDTNMSLDLYMGKCPTKCIIKEI